MRLRSVWGVVLFAVAVCLVTDRAFAGDGFYLGADFGVAMAPDLRTQSADRDISTPRCDALVNPQAAGLRPGDDCGDLGTTWTTLDDFDGATGFLAGLALGYRWNNFRIEGEYFYRGASYDDTQPVDLGGGLAVSERGTEEIEEAIDAVDDLLSHNLFANLYYDFNNTDSKWTPYVGVGAGFAWVSLDYFTRWQRNLDPDAIRTFCTPDGNGDTAAGCSASLSGDAATATATLAGTTSIGRSDLSDTLFGWQALAGVDYRISEPLSVGLKLRWADFGTFEDGDEWSQLRSHDAINSLDATDPRSARVRYTVRTDDIQFWGISLNLKYHF